MRLTSMTIKTPKNIKSEIDGVMCQDHEEIKYEMSGFSFLPGIDPHRAL